MLRLFYKLSSFCFLSFLLYSKAVGQVGIVPVAPPTGGFAIDGYLQRQGTAGDWLAGPGGNQNGTFILTNQGVSLFPSSFSFHAIDLWDDNNDDVFANNNRFNDDPNTMNWTLRKANAKNDINHGLIFISTDPATGEIWVILSADRLKASGMDIIDFEFLQNPIVQTAAKQNGSGGFISSGPDRGRTFGDFVISVQLSNQNSSISPVSLYKWFPGAPGYWPVSFPVYGAINETPIQVPYGAFGSSTYSSKTFVETSLGLLFFPLGNPGNLCSQGIAVRTIWIKSKSSFSNTAQLEDFISLIQLPFNLDGFDVSIQTNFLDLYTAELTASVTPGSVNDYDFHWTSSPANPPGGSLNDPNIYNPVFTTTVPEGCISYSYEVEVTSKSTGCIVARKSFAINSPCKIGKPINPDRPNLQQDIINETIDAKNILIYPNPNKGSVIVFLPTLMDVDLINSSGQNIRRWRTVGEGNMRIENLSTGVYILRTVEKNTGKITNQKIVVAK